MIVARIARSGALGCRSPHLDFALASAVRWRSSVVNGSANVIGGYVRVNWGVLDPIAARGARVGRGRLEHVMAST